MTRTMIENMLAQLGIVKYKIIEDDRTHTVTFKLDRSVDIRTYWDIADSFRPLGVRYILKRLRFYECLFKKKQWIQK